MQRAARAVPVPLTPAAVQEVMDAMKLGPNGSLLYCMEYLVRGTVARARGRRVLRRAGAQEDHADDWLQEVLDGFGEDDYIVFDCPGQARRLGAAAVCARRRLRAVGTD